MEVTSKEARELILSGEAPDNLTVGGRLNLIDCTSLTSLPDNLTVGGGLYLYRCTSLTSLPDNLTVGGWLYLYRCTSLTSLPDNLTVGGSLNLSGCTSLTSLPDNLTVGRWLNLSGCTSLTSLPDNLTVGGSLNLSGSGLIGTQWRGGILDFIDGISTLVMGKGRKVGEARLYSARYLRNIAPDKELPKCYVARQGEYSAHGDTSAGALRDLRFKIAQSEYDAEKLIDAIKQRGTVRWEDFRLVTGACSSGLREGMAMAGLDPSIEELPLALVLEKAHGPYGEAFKQHFEG